MAFTVKTEITDERIVEVLTNFMDHSYEWWRGKKWGPGLREKVWAYWGYDKKPSAPKGEVPFVFPDEGPVLIVEVDDPDKAEGEEPFIKKEITKADIQKGLDILWPRVLSDIVNETDDSDTADTLMQFIVFGKEPIYG